MNIEQGIIDIDKPVDSNSEVKAKNNFEIDEKTKETINNIFAKQISALSDFEKRVLVFNGDKNDHDNLMNDINDNLYVLGTLTPSVLAPHLVPDGSRQLTKDMEDINNLLLEDKKKHDDNPSMPLELFDLISEKFHKIQTESKRIIDILNLRNN